MVEISAKQGLNIDKLLDVILLVADMNEKEITADYNIPAAGTIIESHVDKGMGPVATLLVQAGILKKNDPLVVNGEIYGKVRAMKNYKGELIEEAAPSVPVQIIGFKVAPQVGDILDVASAEYADKIDVKAKKTQQTGAEQFGMMKAGSEEEGDVKKKFVNLLIKADVLGSLEAIIGSLENIIHEEVTVQIIGKGLGNINEDDVHKAIASKSKVVGFNVKATPIAEESMRENGIEFLQFNIIYDLIDYVKVQMEKMLDQEKIIKELGNAKVLAVFRTDKGAMTVGARIEYGKAVQNALARVKRSGQIIGKGKISECQTGKQKTKEVPSGTECGLRFEGKTRIEEGDVVEFYTEESKVRKLGL
jgi:translation initiation factor IF-2